MPETTPLATYPRRRAARPSLRCAAFAALLALLGAAGLWPGVATAQESASVAPTAPEAAADPAPALEVELTEVETEPGGEVEEILAEIGRDFRVVPLSDRLLLEPVVEFDGLLFLEIHSEGFAIDGEPVTGEELESRLGEAAAAVTALAGVEPSEVRRVLGAAAADVAPPAPPERVARPERPRRPRPPRARADRSDSQVVVGSDVTVERDEEVLEVVVFGGDLTVDGRVLQNAVALGGTVRVDGEVMGDAASVGSSVYLGPRAIVHGDTVSVGGKVELADGAEAHGDVVEVPFVLSNFAWNPANWSRFARHGDGDWSWWSRSPIRRTLDRSLEIAWSLIALSILALFACLALLIFRRPVERIGTKAGEEPWKAALAGLLSQILIVPILVFAVIILAISIIGIPLLLLVPFALLALVVVAFLGYVAAGARLGDWLGERFGWRLESPYLVLLVGLAALHVWSFLGEVLDLGPGPIRFFAVMFGIFGALLIYVASTVGFGAALLTRFGTADSWERRSVPGEGTAGDYEALPPVPDGVEDDPAAEAWEGSDGEPEDSAGAADEGSFDEPDAGEPKSGGSA